jgi:hypothetical protein
MDSEFSANLSTKITRVGMVAFPIFVLGISPAIIYGTLDPSGPIPRLVDHMGGRFSWYLEWLGAFSIVGVVLQRLGYPLTMPPDDQDTKIVS